MNIKITLLLVFVLAFSQVWSQNIENQGRSVSVNPIKIEVKETINIKEFSEFISDQDEPSNSKDQVVMDDMIIQGSLAVGTDAIDGETFGYNTIILKENNVRLKFEDTSASATFPGNDWILEANSSVNGGTNHFAIQDATAVRNIFMMEAGARENSLYIDPIGKIGIGTATPTTLIHATYGDTPALRLEQDGTSGWTPQIWDISGNETNFFIRDATNGSTLPFRIQPGAPTDVLTLKASGFVGVGTWNPTSNLDVVGDIKLSNVLKVSPILTVPASPIEGDVFMDGTEHALKFFDGTDWQTTTDNQDLVNASLTGTLLQIDIESGTSVSVDLQPMVSDNQDLISATLLGTILEIEIENGTSVSVDLQPLLTDIEDRLTALENSSSIANPDDSTPKLYQNSPNPYGNNTSIGFNIPDYVNHAVLKITDVKGVTVKEVVIYDRGKSGLLIDENFMSNGTYFYSLILDGNKLDTKIMVKVD